MTTRDAEALERIFALGATAVNHPTGTRWERAGSLTLLRGLFGAWDLHLRNEPLATLGDRLALCRSSLSFSELANEALGPFGSVERESVVLVEVDARGERTRTEFFATDHLGDAIARLYERHAELLPDGPARVRAVAIARTVAALLGPPDLERWAAVLAPGLEFTDPRNVGLGTVVVGAEPLLRSVRVLMELSYDFGIRVDDVLDLRPDVLLVRWTTHGRDRASGGAFERNLCQLWVFGPGGRLARWEQSDGDAVEEALARFDALVGDPRVRSIENAATRSAALSGAAWRDRDWERLASFFAPGFRLVDRRTLSHIDLDREQHLENLRLSFAMDSSRYQSEVLATRGERHALSRLVWSGGRLAGPSEIEWLEVAELDERGRFLRIVTFEQQDVDAAFAELDARYAATAANGHARVSATMRAFREAFAERDWQKLEAQFTPDLVVHDHRRLGWETLRGPAAYVDAMRSLVDLAPDVRLRLDHVRTCDRGLFWVARWLGTREGGRFEAPWITVCRHDEQGRVQRFDQYDLDQLDAALARYTELVTRPPQGPRIENTATRAMERVGDAWRARDAAALAGLAAPGFRNLDRRRIVATDLDRDRFLESFGRVLLEASRAQFWSQVLATRGDRAALVRVCIETSGEIDGPSEFELLQIIEVDAAGRIVAGFGFDPDALDAAFTELDGRYGDPEMAALLRDVHARDWDAVAAQLAPDLVVVDHRRLGFEPQRGPAAFVAWIRSLIELAPDARLRVEHAEERDGRRLASASVAGTRHGGRFELAHAVVTVLDERRCIRRMDLYDRDQHELARARFVGVAPGGAGDSLAARARPDVMSAEDGDAIGDPRFGALRPDPARVGANAASHATERLAELVTGGGWPVLRALATSDFRFEDRRRRALVSGDVELYIRNMEWVLSWQGRRVEREILASMGDRISLDRIAWSGEVEGSTIEGEFIRLIEVDADGRPRAVIHFDPEDRDAAFEEAHARRAGRESRAGAARPREACGPEAAAATSERPRAGVLVGFRVILHEGVVHEAVRPALADGIRRAYAALFEIPAASVNVDFTELARGRFFTAGRPSTSSIVAGTVPAGTSTELRHRLLAEITNLWCETTGCTPHEIVVTAGNAPR